LNITDEIVRLKKEKQAVIIVHNYQRPEVQDLGDFIGDSLGLARQAARTDARMIVFCGVRFMAETAKILSPEKKVLLPREDAGCPMADMITAEELAALKKQYPDAAVVSYVNTNADVKAESDVCCTSANAVEILKNLEAERIIFVPDRNLASYCQRFVDKEIIPWNGYCYVHQRISLREVRAAKEKYPHAPFLAHPECTPDVIDAADEVLSTSGMVRFAGESEAQTFIIGTEEGLIYRLTKENPGKRFLAAGTAKICVNMKLTSLDDVYNALLTEKPAITVPEEIRIKAKKALDRMIRS